MRHKAPWGGLLPAPAARGRARQWPLTYKRPFAWQVLSILQASAPTSLPHSGPCRVAVRTLSVHAIPERCVLSRAPNMCRDAACLCLWLGVCTAGLPVCVCVWVSPVRPADQEICSWKSRDETAPERRGSVGRSLRVFLIHQSKEYGQNPFCMWSNDFWQGRQVHLRGKGLSFQQMCWVT